MLESDRSTLMIEQHDGLVTGTAATDGITLGSTAATNYLVLVSATARDVL